jgi:hypothetical protein
MAERENNNKGQEARLSGLKLHVPRGTFIPTNDNLAVRRCVRLKAAFGRRVVMDQITPLISEQSIPPFRVRHGGGREHGGGFSKKAIQKARKESNKR